MINDDDQLGRSSLNLTVRVTFVDVSMGADPGKCIKHYIQSSQSRTYKYQTLLKQVYDRPTGRYLYGLNRSCLDHHSCTKLAAQTGKLVAV